MLYKPPNNSSKGENGILLYIGGSKEYSGASILALKSAIRFCDIVLFYPTQYDEFLINSVKVNVPEVIVVEDLERSMKRADAILFGSGSGNSFFNFEILKRSGKKVIIDGDGFKHIKAPLSRKFLLTPNKKEFDYLIKLYSSKSILDLTRYLNCIILKKGRVNKLSDGIKVEEIEGGNAGLTKGGSGDILAGVISSLATKNDLFASAKYGLRIVQEASNILFKQKSYYYSMSELIEMLGFASTKIK